MYDLIIIGGGVTGASLARRLARYKIKMALVEKNPDIAMGASKANTAIIHGGYAESHQELRGRICYPGRLAFDQLNKELNFGFEKNGSLVIGFDQEDKKEIERLYQQGLDNGLEDIEIIGRDRIRELEPNIAPGVNHALYCRGAGIISPYEYVIALVENAVDNGLDLYLNSQIEAIRKEGDHFVLEDQKGRTYKTSYLVNASGLEGAAISRLISQTDFDIHPRSGQYILMKRGTGDRIKSTIFQVPTPISKGILVARTYHNNLLLGPDALDQEEARKDTDLVRLAQIFQGAQRSVQAQVLDINDFIRSFAGLRPVSSTGDFIIEESPTPSFINAVGIQSPGITSSPKIGEILEEILRKSGLKLEEDPAYNPYRPAIYQEPSYRPMGEIADQVALPLGDPQRIICRCQQVKETTIREALERSTPVETLDGIKRRTMASTGICQGAFCRPRLIDLSQAMGRKLLDHKTDIEREEVKRVQKKDLVEYIKNQGK